MSIKFKPAGQGTTYSTMPGIPGQVCGRSKDLSNTECSCLLANDLCCLLDQLYKLDLVFSFGTT